MSLITKNLLLSLVAALGFAGGAHAATTDADASLPPDKLIEKATTEFQTLIAANHEKYKANLGEFYKVVDQVVVPHFDTKAIAQLVLGRNWKEATPDQRKRFEEAFKDSLIQTYARAMLDYYDSVKAEWKPMRAAADATRVTVNSTLVRNDAPPIPLAFSLQKTVGGWKVYDISVENISLVTSFRSQINTEIKSGGLDAVIQKLEQNTYFKKDGGSAS